MNQDEELLPVDDSVFDAVLQDSFDISSDELVDDSFSSLVSSNPTSIKGRLRSTTRTTSPAPGCTSSTTSSPAPASSRLSTRSSSPAPFTARMTTRSSSPAPASSRLSTRSSLPAPFTARMTTRSSSPAPASTRMFSRSSSPAPFTDHIATRSSSPAPSTSGASSTVLKSSSAISKATRIKCSECPSTLANERPYAVYKKLHALNRAFLRASNSPEELLRNICDICKASLGRMCVEPTIGVLGLRIKNFTEAVRNSLGALEEAHDLLFNFLHEHFSKILNSNRKLFASSLTGVYYVEVNKLLNDNYFKDDLSCHIMGIDALPNPGQDVLNVFMGSFMPHLTSDTVIYLFKKIHGATSNDEIRRKRSADKLDSKTFLEICYYIGGSVVSGFLFKREKYRQNSDKLQAFFSVLHSKFLRDKSVGNECPDEVAGFTTSRDRGGHISQEALEFFVVLFDLIMSLEGADGSLPTNVTHDHVLQDNVIICLWDVLVGTDIDENASLDFLMQMCEACKLIVMKGIMKRRLNEHLKTAYASVSLRSRLAE